MVTFIGYVPTNTPLFIITFSGLIMYITIYTIAIFLACNYLNSIIVLGFIVLLILFGLVVKFIEECIGGE